MFQLGKKETGLGGGRRDIACLVLIEESCIGGLVVCTLKGLFDIVCMRAWW